MHAKTLKKLTKFSSSLAFQADRQSRLLLCHINQYVDNTPKFGDLEVHLFPFCSMDYYGWGILIIFSHPSQNFSRRGIFVKICSPQRKKIIT